MYNYYASEKKKQQTQKSEKVKTTEQKLQAQKSEKDKILLRRFVDRTTHCYERMADLSAQIKDYRSKQHQFRDFNQSANVGPPSFYFKCRNSKQRVNDALKQNESLDEVPFFGRQNPSFHKFRENKSVDNFKFTPYDTTSRVLENVQKMFTNQLPNSWDLDLHKYLQTHRKKSTGKSDGKHTERKEQKCILPLLNIKRHPKSVASIQNKLTLGPLKNILNQTKKLPSHSQIKEVILKRASMMKSNTVHVPSSEPNDENYHDHKF